MMFDYSHRLHAMAIVKWIQMAASKTIDKSNMREWRVSLLRVFRFIFTLWKS